MTEIIIWASPPLSGLLHGAGALELHDENWVSLDQATATCAGRPQKCQIK